MPISIERKIRFLSRAYFGVSDNPYDDVNPFMDLESFLQATVGELRWGESLEVRQRSKIRFASNFSEVLDSFNITISVEDTWTVIQDDEKSNIDVVEKWVELANFQEP
jgi:hypothetical protein